MSLTSKFAVATLAAMMATTGAAAQTATQTVTFQVDPINQISVTGTPSLSITAATAGSAPTSVTATGATYAVTTNQTGAKITGQIGSAMPSGVTLSVTLGAPSGATSAGEQALTTSAVDLVTGITKLNASGLSITYGLAATSAAGVITATTRVVTYTITGGV